MADLLKHQNGLFDNMETMLAMVSHDLKNPVNAGILAVKLLNNNNFSPLNPYQREILDNIMISLKYMKSLIENILDRYKLDNNVYELHKIPVEFVSFVNTVIEQSKYIFGDKFQTIKLIVDAKNCVIDIDTLEMSRVINNLAANSSRYSKEGSEIIIRIFEDENNICFSIENNGIGIKNPAEVFNKFVTYNDSSKSIATGLGLYIVKEIISAHGGKVYIESEMEKFTRVTFTLPNK